jgi:hypothetical protein
MGKPCQVSGEMREGQEGGERCSILLFERLVCEDELTRSLKMSLGGLV